jgi:hypothetical protein
MSGRIDTGPPPTSPRRQPDESQLLQPQGRGWRRVGHVLKLRRPLRQGRRSHPTGDSSVPELLDAASRSAPAGLCFRQAQGYDQICPERLGPKLVGAEVYEPTTGRRMKVERPSPAYLHRDPSPRVSSARPARPTTPRRRRLAFPDSPTPHFPSTVLPGTTFRSTTITGSPRLSRAGQEDHRRISSTTISGWVSNP